ncbi:MAG: DUF6174 domain-containing protein [Gemmatimonadaceae bacterium]
MRDGVPYFASQIEERYRPPLIGDVVHTETTRLYFDDDRLIRWVDSTGTLRAITGPSAEEHVRDAMQSFRALARCATRTAGSVPCEPSERIASQHTEPASSPGAPETRGHPGALVSRETTDSAMRAETDSGEISHNQSTWRKSQPRKYSFEYRFTCFCPGSGITYRATVDNGSMISRTVVGPAPGAPISAPPLTIDSLFATIKRAQLHRAPKIEVKFDSVRHFPKSIYILWQTGVTDSDTRVEVLDFRTLKRKSRRLE